MADLVSYRADGAVARLTLDSPHNRNALSSVLVEQLHAGLRRAADDPAVRAIVLGHTGGTFCAGADLSEATNADPRTAMKDRTTQLAALLRAIVECPVPVIAAVDGHVRAGGMGLVGACDIAIAGTRSTFALTEVRIGVAPAVISLTLLPKMTPRAAARYYLTGETFNARQAAEVGLISEATDDIATAVDAVTSALAKGSPQGLAASKAYTTEAVLAGFDRDATRFAEQSAQLFDSDEAREGMMAFLEKRSPRWAPPL